MNTVHTPDTELHAELRAMAAAAAAYAAPASDLLAEAIDCAATPDPVAVSAALAAIRPWLLAADVPEAAIIWEDFVAAAQALRGPLIDAFHAQPFKEQRRTIARLEALAASGNRAVALLVPLLADKGLLVAVAGDFKRGKSTLLNALLGSRLLPTRVAPATAVPCLLRFAPELTVRVYYHDGRPSEVIPVRDLERYACIPLPSDDDNLVAFRPEVARLEIGLPWSLPENLTLLDLPGLNEEDGRAEVARTELAHADTVLVVLAATQLLAEDELQFLDTLWAEGHRSFTFAINYLDRLEHGDQALVEERASILLAPYGGVLERNAFLVSARQALIARDNGEETPLESGIPALESSLYTLLVAEHEMLWGGSRLRQCVDVLEDAEWTAGRQALQAQDEARIIAHEIARQEAILAAPAYSDRVAAAAHAVDMARQQVIDRERHFDDRWTALETEIRDRSRLQPHSWVYQQMGIWLREEMIRIIREVHPEVTPRPEGYLRISVAPGLRLGRDALSTFYRNEAAREWARFTGEARRAGKATLEALLLEAEQARQLAVDEMEAERTLSETRLATLRVTREEAATLAAELIHVSREAATLLRAVLEESA